MIKESNIWHLASVAAALLAVTCKAGDGQSTSDLAKPNFGSTAVIRPTEQDPSGQEINQAQSRLEIGQRAPDVVLNGTGGEVKLSELQKSHKATILLFQGILSGDPNGAFADALAMQRQYPDSLQIVPISYMLETTIPLEGNIPIYTLDESYARTGAYGGRIPKMVYIDKNGIVRAVRDWSYQDTIGALTQTLLEVDLPVAGGETSLPFGLRPEWQQPGLIPNWRDLLADASLNNLLSGEEIASINRNFLKAMLDADRAETDGVEAYTVIDSLNAGGRGLLVAYCRSRDPRLAEMIEATASQTWWQTGLVVARGLIPANAWHDGQMFRNYDTACSNSYIRS